MKIKPRQRPRENKQVICRIRAWGHQQKSSVVCVFFLVDHEHQSEPFFTGLGVRARLRPSGVCSAACFYKTPLTHTLMLLRLQCVRVVVQPPAAGLAAVEPTELPFPVPTPHGGTQRPQSSGASPNPAALLLVRYHNLIISMMLFFPISGINTIKTELSVFIVPGFVMIVN